MSYDIYLNIDTGKHSHSVWDQNITSNVRDMYNKAFDADYWVDEVDGQKCADISERMVHACNYMEANEAIIKPLEPSNGWGTYETALEVLKKLKDAVLEHPNCTILISK